MVPLGCSDRTVASDRVPTRLRYDVTHETCISLICDASSHPFRFIDQLVLRLTFVQEGATRLAHADETLPWLSALCVDVGDPLQSESQGHMVVDKDVKQNFNFNCGICTKRLTDTGALFTSCGHLFCANERKSCTALVEGSPAGKCEQCGQDCDAGTPSKAAECNARVKEFLFAPLAEQLRTIAEIMEVRYVVGRHAFRRKSELVRAKG